MTKYLLLLLFVLSFPSLAGVTVVGTRFIFDNETKRIAIKLINDNQSDFLIKTTIADNNGQFVISPPLMVMPKNGTNVQLIMPINVAKTNVDKLYQLTIMMIPKSQLDTSKASISLALRSHFNLIYRHDALSNADFNQLKLIKNQQGQYELKNFSNFILTIDMANNQNNQRAIRKTVIQNQSIPIAEFCRHDICGVWLSFIADDQSVIRQRYLSNQSQFDEGHDVRLMLNDD